MDPSSVTGLFNTLAGATSFEGVVADNGEGGFGPWPPDGDHPCFIPGMIIDEKALFFDGKASAAKKLAAVSVAFQYMLCDPLPTDEPGKPMEFTGAKFIIPRNEKEISTDGSKTKWDIDKRRLKGSVEALLGRVVDNPVAAIPEVFTLLTGGRVAARVKCTSREGTPKAGSPQGTKGTLYHSDFIQEKINR